VSKNVIICCDGTNSSLQGNLTNVGRMSCIVAKEAEIQHVYYDAGVGVWVKQPGLIRKLAATLYRWAGLAFGAGLMRNVVAAYRELVCNMTRATGYSCSGLVGELIRYECWQGFWKIMAS
jgi:uncharacterized protein (DUF2235 family)